ncbi:hypothetical protein KL86PLE_90620 [uncultured Pleomorphomonas sp.]|uniref:Uncharacterized protein n=1 Tax=uncultured Pleomorphomonas sp. TaxID=442121 RepID=A0A212LQM6_9HYPH|nr:hypothetical protein KL86PLE_90620 [uncultured Pleomorphomonas sp.]
MRGDVLWDFLKRSDLTHINISLSFSPQRAWLKDNGSRPGLAGHKEKTSQSRDKKHRTHDCPLKPINPAQP